MGGIVKGFLIRFNQDNLIWVSRVCFKQLKSIVESQDTRDPTVLKIALSLVYSGCRKKTSVLNGIRSNNGIKNKCNFMHLL